jgi:hypothetical protein
MLILANAPCVRIETSSENEQVLFLLRDTDVVHVKKIDILHSAIMALKSFVSRI